MVIRPPRTIWMLSAAVLTLTLSGCLTATKTVQELPGGSASASPQVRHSQFTLFNFSGKPGGVNANGSSTPGSAEFSSSKELKDPIKVHLAYAVWHEGEGNLIEARSSYNKVLEKSSKNVEALLGLARLDIALGRLDDAEPRLLKAQKLAPKSPQVEVALGQYYTARMDWPRAIEHMQAARTLSPYDPVYAYHLGHVQAKAGHYAEALSNFTEAVHEPEAHYNLAVILNEQGDMAAAEEHLQKALAQKPELHQAQKLLAIVRQQRHANETQFAKFTRPGGDHRATSSRRVETASYSEPAATERDGR